MSRPITIAIVALGGQGGGVLANWIRDIGQSNGHIAQSTSVPGVAQRTGSTVYYLELFPESEAGGREPHLSLSAVAGDVDIVIAAELMEAGRAVQRGFVTPDRTTLIASSHRAFAVAEKIVQGNGIADGEAVIRSAQAAAHRFLHFDMQALADASGAVISAALLGALAGSGALPFPREAYERVIRGRGAAAETNLRAFAAAFERAVAGGDQALATTPAPVPGEIPDDGSIATRIRQRLPQPVQTLAWEACLQLTDFQDARYARQFLDALESVVALDDGREDHALSCALARHLSQWMAYQDVIRVAAQKTRSARYADMRREVRAGEQDLVYPVEFMHPRLEEICDILPRALGAWILGSPRLADWLRRFFGKGRLHRTYSLRGFLQLAALASLRPMRRLTMRYDIEHRRIRDWLARIAAAAPHAPELALEIARCQRLLKGYSDTQERGWRSFARIMEFVADAPVNGQTAQIVARLHAAALADEQGTGLERELCAVRAG